MEHKCPNGHWKGDKDKDLPSGKCNACGADLVSAGEPEKVKEPATIAAEALLAEEQKKAYKPTESTWTPTPEPATKEPEVFGKAPEPRLSRKQQRAQDREDAAKVKTDTDEKYSPSFTTDQGDGYASKEESGEYAGVFKEVEGEPV